MQQNRTIRGVLFLCAGVLLFSIQDAIVKAVSGSYALTEVVTIRALVSFPILLGLVMWETDLKALRSKNLGILIVRSVIMLTAYTTYYMAFPALKLADAVALFFTVPLFTLALAAPILGEKIGWRRITAVTIGFIGVLVMLRPGAGLFEPAVELGATVRAGDLCGHVHFVDDPARPAVPCFFRKDGFVICQRHYGRVERGDCLAHLAIDA